MRILERAPGDGFSLFRLIWLTAAARDTWARPIIKASRAVQDLELESVLAGKRECCTTTIDPAGFFDFMKAHPDLDIRPLRRTKKFQGFAHRHEDPAPGEDFYIYAAVGRNREATRRFETAYQANDHVEIGRLLGFPECCGRFFSWVWPEGFIDPIWQMAAGNVFGDPAHEGPERMVEIKDPHPFSNPLLRYLGLRVSFHIPHSFRCQETIDRTAGLLELVDPESKTVLEALLSMPMEWDANHEIAQIKTPIFWLIINTTRTAERYQVKLAGKFIPKEAA